jgi:S-adenosyl-L-methionine hydrolase (adenosine-forming)
MLITLTTDFGHRDPFVGIMKGVIAGINPAAQVIDLTHGIPPQDIMAAALALRHSIKYFPLGTIHVVVVDPGVGGARRPLLIEMAGNYFIGPDNGVLSLALNEGRPEKIIELTNAKYHLKAPAATFHGRDIFAPVAAHLSSGVPPDQFGDSLSSFVKLGIPQVTREQKLLTGEIIYADHYGNLFTNISAHDLRGLSDKEPTITVGSVTLHGLIPSYDSVAVNQVGALINSWGVLEIAVNQGSAAQKCRAKVGDKVTVISVSRSGGGN